MENVMKKLAALFLLGLLFVSLTGWGPRLNRIKRVDAAEYTSAYVQSELIGKGRQRLTISSSPVAYQDGGVWKKIDSNFVDGTDSSNEVNTAQMKVKVYPDGARKIMPTGEADKYLLLGRPYVLNVSSVWQPVDFGAPVRTGNKLVWTKAVGGVTITHIGHGLKHEIELFGGYVPRESKFAYPISFGGGVTRVGTSLVLNGVTVAVLQKPVVYDADNPMDVRQITYSFESLNGVTPAVVSTLPDLTGMTRPVVDPTVTLQPGAAAGIDTRMLSDNATSNYGVSTAISVGENNAAVGQVHRTLIKFDLTTIPNTFTSAKLYLYADLDLSSNARTMRVYRLLRAWVEGTRDGVEDAPATGATWNRYDTTNNWATAGGFGAADCEQTDIGSLALGAAETINEVKIIPLTPTTKAGLGTLGWLIKMDTETDDLYRFVSSDAATAANRPKLVIEYTTGHSGPRWSRLDGFREPRGRLD